MYQYPFEFLFSIFLGRYQGTELMNHVVILCLTFQGIAKLFSISLYRMTWAVVGRLSALAQMELGKIYELSPEC